MPPSIKCPYCEKDLAGEGHLRRHVTSIHELKSSQFLDHLTGIVSSNKMNFDRKNTFSIK